MQLEIFIDPSHPKRPTEPESLGIRHLAFNVDDLDKARQEFDCGPICTDWLGERYCMTTDPDTKRIKYKK